MLVIEIKSSSSSSNRHILQDLVVVVVIVVPVLVVVSVLLIVLVVVVVVLTPLALSWRVWVSLIVNTACDLLLSLFILVAATVRDLFPSNIRFSISCKVSTGLFLYLGVVIFAEVECKEGITQDCTAVTQLNVA